MTEEQSRIKMESKTKNKKNQLIVEQFEKLLDQINYNINDPTQKAKKNQNMFRMRSISKALNIIKRYSKVIKSGKDIEHLAGVGKGTIKRIDEILTTGKLSEVIFDSDVAKHRHVQALRDLEEIIGIGPVTAEELIRDHGIMSVEELLQKHRSGEITLSHQIQMGLKYHNVYQKNIPRKEIDKIKTLIFNTIRELDPKLVGDIAGSYRRGNKTSNDVDVIITHPKIKTKKKLQTHIPNYLRVLVECLHEEGFLVDDLTDQDFTFTYRGFCQYNNKPVRRIDIKYVPMESYYSGLVHFTGPMELNTIMRKKAIELGYRLNEYGFFQVKDNGSLKRLPVTSEKDVFDYLGMEYLEPTER